MDLLVGPGRRASASAAQSANANGVAVLSLFQCAASGVNSQQHGPTARIDIELIEIGFQSLAGQLWARERSHR